MTYEKTNSTPLSISFRIPGATDGARVHRLIDICKPLDTNSMYCNLLQCSHFADTCVLAEVADGGLVGFTSGYVIPGRPDILFVWQIAVHESARGQGLAGRMVNELLARPNLQHIRFIETSITPANQASAAVFEKLANALETQIEREIMFSRNEHFAGMHDDEILFRVGPFRLSV